MLLSFEVLVVCDIARKVYAPATGSCFDYTDNEQIADDRSRQDLYPEQQHFGDIEHL